MGKAQTSTGRTITLTEEAVQVLKEFAHQAQRVHWGLKFADEVSACGEGYNYVIDLVTSPGEQDVIYWSQDIPIYVPKESVHRLEGSVIEYHAHDIILEQPKGNLKKCFHVKNPNAKGPCPCTCGDGMEF